MAPSGDTVHINELVLTLAIANNDAQEDATSKPQSVSLSLAITHDISRAARADDLTSAVNYASVCTTLVETLPKSRYTSLEALVDHAFECLFRSHPEVNEARVVMAMGSSSRSTIETTHRRDRASTGPTSFSLNNLQFPAIIGVNPHERTEKQPVEFDIVVRRQQSSDPFPFLGLSDSIRQKFGPSEYRTVEALASAVACHVLEYTKDPEDEVTVRLSKPNALALAASAHILITRRRDDFPDVFSPRGNTDHLVADSSLHSVAVSLGSNLGDRFANIETALRLLELPFSLLSDLPDDATVSVIDTSFMYETAPMYVIDQPRFINCACIIETNLSPMELLRLVKEIETVVGRVPGLRFGPRVVDLDILTYDYCVLDTRPVENQASLDNLTGELVIPHPRLCEREFVLRPLNDMIPGFLHPVCNRTVRTLLDDLVASQTEVDFPMLKVMPFPKYPLDSDEIPKIGGVKVIPTAKHWTVPSADKQRQPPRKTYLMATLNVTPDSFSDGARYHTLPAAMAYATAAVASGADIIDIGGCSTRPGAQFVSPEEETRRVVPVIQAIRAHPDDAVRHALISVDTFRWDVAEEAVRAGANCINDVYAFAGPTYPPDATSAEYRVRMRALARELGVPVVLMHSRGEAGANKDYSAYPGGLLDGIQTELGGKVDAIVRGPGGVRRWLVFVDPGIGFSKPVKEQMALMRDLSQVTADTRGNKLAGYPLLLGASKKSALGVILEEPDVEGTYKGRRTKAEERGWATAAAVACAVQQGANVVRVHDVANMKDVVLIASAIWSR